MHEMANLINEATLDPVVMYMAAAHYALAIVVAFWMYHVRKADDVEAVRAIKAKNQKRSDRSEKE
jgi:hypothetical protein